MKIDLQKIANSFARKNGHGKATKIVFGSELRIVSHTPYGYRKRTTGQYVPNKYLSNFGWKNTYYQRAETVVMVPAKLKKSLIQ